MTRRDFGEEKHLAVVDSDLGDVDRPAGALTFLREQVIAKPVAQHSDRIANGLGFLFDPEIARAQDIVGGEEVDLPLAGVVIAHDKVSAESGKS